MRIRDIELPKGVTSRSDGAIPVATVSVTRQLKEEEKAAAATPAAKGATPAAKGTAPAAAAPAKGAAAPAAKGAAPAAKPAAKK